MEGEKYYGKRVVCGSIDEVWERYIDGELREQNQRRIAQHLLSCKECDEKINSRSKLYNALKSVASSNEFFEKLSKEYQEKLHRVKTYDDTMSRESMN